MSNIKRYDFLIMANNDTRMAQTNIGDYVLFSDHEQRVKELERWRKPLERRVLEANEEVEELEAENKKLTKALEVAKGALEDYSGYVNADEIDAYIKQIEKIEKG